MRTIYLDHNIAHYFVRGFPAGVDAGIEEGAMRACLHPKSEVSFVLSDWNLVEAARESARQANPLDEAGRYADFFESLRSLFIEGHDALERTEMRNYAYSRWKIPGASTPQNWMFATEFTQIALSRTPEILLGFNLRIYLRHLVKTESSRKEIGRSVGTALSAQQIGIDAHNDGELDKRKMEINRSWLLALLPERDPDGKWIAVQRRQELADELSQNVNDVFRHCPAIFTESVMTDIRATAGGRKARPQDALDLMHIVPALSYCDAFVSNDGPLLKQATKACISTSRRVVVSASLSEALNGLQGAQFNSEN